MECKECKSNNMQIVKYVISNGAIQYRWQCKDCGYVDLLSIAYSKLTDEERENAPLLDKNAREKLIENKLLTKKKEYEEKREQGFNKLSEYYKSPEWQEKRIMRLRLNERLFDGWCERCGMYRAEHIHHRSYDVLGGREHPFDLEALCEHCHKALHPHMED